MQCVLLKTSFCLVCFNSASEYRCHRARGRSLGAEFADYSLTVSQPLDMVQGTALNILAPSYCPYHHAHRLASLLTMNFRVVRGVQNS